MKKENTSGKPGGPAGPGNKKSDNSSSSGPNSGANSGTTTPTPAGAPSNNATPPGGGPPGTPKSMDHLSNPPGSNHSVGGATPTQIKSENDDSNAGGGSAVLNGGGDPNRATPLCDNSTPATPIEGGGSSELGQPPNSVGSNCLDNDVKPPPSLGGGSPLEEGVANSAGGGMPDGGGAGAGSGVQNDDGSSSNFPPETADFLDSLDSKDGGKWLIDLFHIIFLLLFVKLSHVLKSLNFSEMKTAFCYFLLSPSYGKVELLQKITLK